jgi:hypothetical protein
MGCKETARLLSESRDRRLSLRQWFSLRFHMAMCRMCKIYARQMNAVGRICREAGERSLDACPGELSPAQKDRIKTSLRRPD